MSEIPRERVAGQTTPGDLLEFFYPVHYQMGTALEEVLSGGVLSRKQVAILWLIRSEGLEGREMRRKDIETALRTWFEISSSAVSKALREMFGPPLAFVEIRESPDSGREKLVSLTPRGDAFLAETTEKGERYVARLVEKMPAEVMSGGAAYLRQLTEGYQRMSRAERLRVVESERP